MATISAPADQAAELLQKLSLDSLEKPLQDPEPAKKVSEAKYSVDVGSQMNVLSKPFERVASPHPDFMNPSMFYNPSGYSSSTYYYGGYNGSSGNDWDQYGTSNGAEMSSGVYGDYQNSSGYAPYGSYSSPGCTIGPDAHLYGPQQFQYPTYYFPPSTPINGPYSPYGVNGPQKDVTTPLAADPVQLSTGAAKGNENFAANVVSHPNNMSKPFKPNYQNTTVRSNDFHGWGGLPAANPGNTSTISFGNNYSSMMRNQNLHPPSHLTGMQHSQVGSGMDGSGYTSQIYPSSRMYGQYPSVFRHGAGYYSNGYGPRTNGNGWLSVDNKYKPKGYGSNLMFSGNDSVYGLNEVNKGPRARGFKGQKEPEPTAVEIDSQTLTVSAKDGEDKSTVFPDKEQYSSDKEQYNRDDFPESHSDAKFFVIKSYSEDDVHKSIKYGVWASTPNGNKKLDGAFKEAQMQDKSGGVPVFLLFSVNASGQFLGLAEMLGPVDFDKSLEYWQQDKWTGCFPVKWHYVKDVPNSILRNITLENNENKPVTNSRDTQEVKLEQGNEIVRLIKGHPSSTCILDDFKFYEAREKALQEKKARQQQLKMQVGEDAVPGTEKDDLLCKQGLQVSVVALDSPEDSTTTTAAT